MPNKTIKFSSEVAYRLNKGYGANNQPVYFDSNGVATAITAANLASFVDGQHKWVRLAGDTMTGHLTVRRNGESAMIVSDGVHYTDNTFRLLLTLNGSTGAQGIWSSGYSDGTTFTSSSKYLVQRDTSGNVKLNGNADTATKWATARTLTIGSAGKSVDGSGNVSWSLSEIGAAASSHSHSYLPLSGGVMTGNIQMAYNGTNYNWLRTYNNGNTGLDACGGGVYIGYNNSTLVNFLNGKASIDSNGCFTASRAVFTSTTDAASSSATTPALIVGGTATTAHIQMDNNEIICKANGTSMAVLYFNENAYVAADGKTLVSHNITASAGYLRSTSNGNTVQIGSQNTSFCHINNSAAIPFWFNQDITIAQGKHIGQAGSQYRPFQIYIGRSTTAESRALNSNNPLIEFANSDRSQYAQIVYTDFNSQGGSDSLTFVSNQSDLRVYAPKVHNAVWNDYAETRATNITEPGRVVVETTTGIMAQANDRLMAGCKIISDTYGTCMGREEDTPIAVSGRVLVYTYQEKEKYELGAAVCSAPGGTVDIMTREEIMKYPERIIGTVSEIPDYDIWYAGQQNTTSSRGAIPITVNGRIWIYVR